MLWLWTQHPFMSTSLSKSTSHVFITATPCSYTVLPPPTQTARLLPTVPFTMFFQALEHLTPKTQTVFTANTHAKRPPSLLFITSLLSSHNRTFTFPQQTPNPPNPRPARVPKASCLHPVLAFNKLPHSKQPQTGTPHHWTRVPETSSFTLQPHEISPHTNAAEPLELGTKAMGLKPLLLRFQKYMFGELMILFGFVDDFWSPRFRLEKVFLWRLQRCLLTFSLG